jgi:hypothetical protein
MARDVQLHRTEALLKRLRYALQMLMAEPDATAIVILVLVLGIGASLVHVEAALPMAPRESLIIETTFPDLDWEGLPRIEWGPVRLDDRLDGRFELIRFDGCGSLWALCPQEPSRDDCCSPPPAFI